MSKQKFKVLVEWDVAERLWVTYVPALDHLSTYGDTREQALAHTKEAILGYLEAAEKEGIAVPEGKSEVEVVELEVTTA